MQTSEKIGEVAAALVAAAAELPQVQMSGRNEYDKYDYAKLDDYVKAVRPILHKHGLAVLTSVADIVPLDDRTTKGGSTERAIRVRLTVRIVHRSGEWVEADAWGEGQDRADKAIYKAITGARKYGLAAALNLSTGDDPEADERVGRDREAKPKAGVRAAIQHTPADVGKKAVTDALMRRGWVYNDVIKHVPQWMATNFGKAKYDDLTPDERQMLLDAARDGELDTMRVVVPEPEDQGQPLLM